MSEDDALHEYRTATEWNNSYSLEDENNHNSFSSQNSAGKSKFHGANALPGKSLKDKSPDSVDHGMRIQSWVGGHAPHGFQKERRTYKLKNPADNVYLHHHE